MPKTGGSSTTTGINFEAWFVAKKLLDVLLEENVEATPQAMTYTDHNDGNKKITATDDLYISKDKKNEFYNLKFRAPSVKDWRIANLKSNKVLDQFKEQFKHSPESDMFFVTQSPCELFHEILPRGASCRTREELEIKLKANNYIKIWDELKNELNLSDDDMLRFAKKINFLPVISTDELKNDISKMLKGRVTQHEYAPNILYNLAIEAATQGETITKEKIIKEFKKNNIFISSSLNPKGIINEIKKSTNHLKLISNKFLEENHIERSEVQELFQWISTSNENAANNICILSGKAGYGKTIIIRDLINVIEEKNIPCLGIKADMFAHENLKELSNELGLKDGIIENLATAVEHHGNGVVLIDQIDALSLSLSKDRKYINNYLNLISQLSSIKNLKIIVSCRTYDLNYDPNLQKIQNKKLVDAKVLDEEEVIKILEKLKIKPNAFDKTLIELLKIPLHLELFYKIYDEKLNINTIKSLTDLYNEVWNKYIQNIQSTSITLKDIKELIYLIVENIDKNKLLNISETIFDEKREAIAYLKSNGIIIGNNNKIGFFHQSFFDYCYAKKFISENKSLHKKLLSEHQGLFVRSQVKQIITFLREINPKEYCSTLFKIIKDSRIRYHIKLLLINQLAFSSDLLDEEKQETYKLLNHKKSFRYHFIESVYSKEWILFLKNKGYFKSIFNSKDNTLINILIWKLSSLIKTYPDIIIDVIIEMPDIKDKDNQIGYILYNLKQWNNAKIIDHFKKKYKDYKNVLDEHTFYPILKNILPYKKELCSKIIFEDINERINTTNFNNDERANNVLDYHHLELVKNILTDENDIKYISEALKIVYKLITKTNHSTEKEYYHDSAFYGNEQFDSKLYTHWQFLDILKKHIHDLAEKNKPELLKLFSTYKDTNSTSMLKIIWEAYSTNPAEYKNEILEFLKRKDFFLVISDISSIKYSYNIIMNKIFSSLSDDEKQTIIDEIDKINPEWEKKKVKNSRSFIGYAKYELLSGIPENELKKFAKTYEDFNVLKRKYGEYQAKMPEPSVVSWVGPPLPETAYEKMTFEQWLASFKKYDESTGWDQPKEDYLKGGLVEHHRKFTEVVKGNPEKYYDFIFSLGKMEDISKEYLAAGINGLVEAKYDLGKIKRLILKYWKESNNHLRRNILRAISYINHEDNLDIELIEVLEEYALNDPDPEKEYWKIKTDNGKYYYNGDPASNGINTIRGSAVDYLGIHGYKTNHPDKIFEIMEKVLDDSSIAVKVCLIRHLKGMIRWNKERAIEIFNKLTKDLNPKLIKYGLEFFAYILNKESYTYYIPHLCVAMKIDEKYGYNNTSEYTGSILMYAYLKNYPNSWKILKKGLKTSNKVIAGAIKHSIKHLNSRNKKETAKAKKIYTKYFNSKDPDISRTYGFEFHEFKIDDMNNLYNIFKKYIKSKVISYDTYYFFEYLLKCTNDYPERCADLIILFIKNIKSISLQRMYKTEDVVNVLIQSYNKVQDNYKEKIMDTFDKILKNTSIKSYGIKILHEQDRG